MENISYQGGGSILVHYNVDLIFSARFRFAACRLAGCDSFRQVGAYWIICRADFFMEGII